MISALRVWYGGAFPVWIATTTYLAMGWGSLFCYRELARTYSHRTLLPLPLGGIFYSVGAVINLLKWPVISPGVFASHEVFHLFVIAGSACHVYFMLRVVIPAPSPRHHGRRPWRVDGPRAPAGRRPDPVATRPALLLRWARAMLSRRVRRWMLHLPHPQWLDHILIDPLEVTAEPRGPPRWSDRVAHHGAVSDRSGRSAPSDPVRPRSGFLYRLHGGGLAMGQAGLGPELAGDRRSTLRWAAWSASAAFGAYFCMYAFRKPFTAATYRAGWSGGSARRRPW